MKRITLIILSLSLNVALASPPATDEPIREEERIQKAIVILEELTDMPEKGMPHWIVEQAQALVIVPDLVKAGLVVGGEYGKGIAIARDASGEWTDPVFIDLTAGSFGFQAGVQSSDVILVFKRKDALTDMGKRKLTLGGDISIAAGPVGRQSSAATDERLQAEIYSYSRSRGLFAGISLEGAVLSMNKKANEAFYEEGVVPHQVLAGKTPSNTAVAKDLKQTLAKLEE